MSVELIRVYDIFMGELVSRFDCWLTCNFVPWGDFIFRAGVADIRNLVWLQFTTDSLLVASQLRAP